MLCTNKNPDDILFPKADGKHSTKSVCRNWWNSFKRQCHIAAGAELYRNSIKPGTGLFDDNLSPHYLRHTYGTDLHAAGVDDFTRRIFMGHVLTDTTDGYTKMSVEAFSRAAAQINLYLNEEKWSDTNGM